MAEPECPYRSSDAWLELADEMEVDFIDGEVWWLESQEAEA